MVKGPLQQSGVLGSDELQPKVSRAGKAWQMVKDGTPLLELMAAGGWRTSAFACYLPKEKQGQEDDAIITEAVVEMAIVASDDEETSFHQQAVIDLALRHRSRALRIDMAIAENLQEGE